mgnify:CR=1 FL=1
MAKNMQPVLKRCRTLGVSPAAMGYSKTSNKNPGGQRRAKKSEYATQLTEKQKVKFVYGIQEKQFRNYYDKAVRAEGNTGEVLLSLVERRLDNVVYRLGFAASRKEARQLVRHGHYTLNGKKANIPSILVKAGDVVSVAEGSRNSDKIKVVTEANASRPVPQWLDADKNQLTAKVVRMPGREDVDMDIEEQQIVEFYSK